MGSPGLLRQLCNLVSDMRKDKTSLVNYITKMDKNQDLLLSKMRKLQSQNAALVHADNLRHLATQQAVGHQLHPGYLERGGSHANPGYLERGGSLANPGYLEKGGSHYGEAPPYLYHG